MSAIPTALRAMPSLVKVGFAEMVAGNIASNSSDASPLILSMTAQMRGSLSFASLNELVVTCRSTIAAATQ